MVEVYEELDECGVPAYGARMETAAAMVAVSGFETEEDALEAVLREMPMVIDCKGKSFFISGPMTGMHLNNAPNFTRVHADLKMRGARLIFDPAHSWLSDAGAEKTHEQYMQACLYVLLNNAWDYIVMLKGWENSAGSKLEHDVAEACGMQVIHESDLHADDAACLPF